MHVYDIPLVPGPTSVPAPVLAVYGTDYGSADLEQEFLDLYAGTQDSLRQILRTQNQIALMSGEGMVALWGALKSTLTPGDPVVAVATGVFGYGIADLARSIGARVEVVNFEYDQAATDLDRIEETIRRVRPKLVTLVHCETPSGIINPAAAVGDLLRRYDVPLYYVDAVASMGGMPVEVDAWRIDLCLGGTQKAFSSLPDLGIVSVSQRAWEVIEEVDYQGYDALAGFKTALSDAYFPYTPNWHATAALYTACNLLLDEGLASVFQRHRRVAEYCRDRVQRIGLSLLPQDPNVSSPTVTAVKIPDGIAWKRLDGALRERRMVIAGSYGPLAGKVFRIGHMGTQANLGLVERGMDVLSEVMQDLSG